VKKIKNWQWLIGIFILSLIIFFPSLTNFFTHDDFFLLKISRISSFGGFLNFFNLLRGPEGLGMYRPLAMQTFYLLDWKLFNLNPLGLHAISFITFFAVVYLVYKLAQVLLSSHPARRSYASGVAGGPLPITHYPLSINAVPLMAAFLYATSASHFGHLYSLGTYPELLVTLFTLLGAINFIDFIKGRGERYLLFSFLCFLGGLLSKETFAIIPALFVLIYLYYLVTDRKNLVKPRTFIISLIPFIAVLIGYFYFRFRYFGLPKGDSYIWVFSSRVFNTLAWYFLWALNLPEMLVDFVGPGLRLNPNLFKYWSREIIPIFVLFGLQLVLLFYAFLKSFVTRNKSQITNHYSLFTFCMAWFVICLLPVLFLPLHKFTYYLTLPLVGFTIFISYLLVTIHHSPVTILFFSLWLSLSVPILALTSETHWMTRGAEISKKVYVYFQINKQTLEGKTIVFYDTDEDKNLPWLPSNLLKVTLSEKNFFDVFYPNRIKAYYGDPGIEGNNVLKIKARQFLGY